MLPVGMDNRAMILPSLSWTAARTDRAYFNSVVGAASQPRMPT